MVARESDGLFADNNWAPIFDETIEIPGDTRHVFKSVYDEHGTYRTTVEQEMEHDILYEQDIAEVDGCHNQAITIGIDNGYISILNGMSERIASENDSNSRSDDANS